MTGSIVLPEVVSTSVPTPPTGYASFFIDTNNNLSAKLSDGSVVQVVFTNPMTAVGDLIVGGTSGTPTRLALGTSGYVLQSNGTTAVWASASGTGTVTSVGLSLPAIFSVSGSPVTSSGTLTATLATETANYVWAGPTSGAAAAPTFRALVLADIPSGVALTASANAFTQQQAVTPYRANITGAVSIDLSATAKSNNLHLTLTGNVTSFALTNPVDGAVYNIRFIQDATGGRTFAGFPPAFKFPGGTAPTFSTAANAIDFLSCEYGSTEATYMAVFNEGMA